MRKVYLAGPEVFLPNAMDIGDRKKRICETYGFAGLFPLDKVIEPVGRSSAEIAIAIYSANVGLMKKADLLIANMTPFRGPSMDVGTAFEVGFCAAKGLPIFGYTNFVAKLADRVSNTTKQNGLLVDENGLEIENFGFFENLMIEVPALKNGGKIFAGPVPHSELFTSLTNFEIAVRHAADTFGLHSSNQHNRARA